MPKTIVSCLLLVIVIAVIGGIFLLKVKPEVLAKWLEPVSFVSGVSGKKELKQTDGRTNILVLGIDGRSAGNAYASSALTDTILVASITSTGENPVLVSIPRDLWIPEKRTKINSLYALSGRDVEVTKKAVQSVSGIPLHYTVIVGFQAFVDAINAVGGVDVMVGNTFDDYQYPIEGKENAEPESARYMHIHFDAGKQHMDGETALKYARSRHATQMEEQGDFARAKRQQKVIDALRGKILSQQTLLSPTKLKALYESFSNNITTDLTITDLLVAADKVRGAQGGDTRKVVLSNEMTDANAPGSGTLRAATEEERASLYDNLYVLIPSAGTYDAIHSLIREQLFGAPVRSPAPAK